MRRFLMLVLVLAVACGGPGLPTADPPVTVPPGDATPAPDAPAGPQDGQPPPPDGSGDAGAPAPPQGGMQDQPPPPAASGNDGGPVGANARAYVQDTFPRLVVEVNAVSGREPSDAALGHLRAKLGEVAAKPAGIEVRRAVIPSSGDRYTVEELKALERRHRRTSTGGDAASVHALYLNGSFAPDEGVLAIVFSASSIAVFPDQIARAATPVVSASRIERSVLLHEMGHLMGLINLGYRSPRDREDPDHPHHSRNRRSVMYWAVETNLVLTILQGPPPDDFDADDRADLADLRTGRL